MTVPCWMWIVFGGHVPAAIPFSVLVLLYGLDFSPKLEAAADILHEDAELLQALEEHMEKEGC